MIKRRKKVHLIFLIITVVQIFLLTNFTVANSYLISQTNTSDSSKKIEENKISKLAKKGINLLVGFLSIKQIGIISAAEEEFEETCCIHANNGEHCVPGQVSGENDACDGPEYRSCNEISECTLGCCYDLEEGSCSPRIPKVACQGDGMNWESDILCSNCKKVGCKFGRNCVYETEKQCENRGGNPEDISHVECFAYSRTGPEGACVYEDNKLCKRQTEKECASQGGLYFLNALCSNTELKEEYGLECEKQDHIGCSENRDGIYWFDSHGNMENIYSGNTQEAKDISNNGGEILNKENSCGGGGGVIEDKNCGNCDTVRSMCSSTSSGEGVEAGDFICEDLGCKNAPARGGGTQDRQNCESWCMYDGVIGDGKDTVGSEHWIYSCVRGNVTSTVAGNNKMRKVLCGEATTLTKDGKNFTSAKPIPNTQDECVGYNAKYSDDTDVLQKRCNENPYCMIRNINVDKYFKFSFCVPKYPKGTSLKDGEDSGVCSKLDIKCPVVYEKGWLGWEVVENGDCEKKEFAQKMQELCANLGDCGSYINYEGYGSDNVRITATEKGDVSDDKADAPSSESWKEYKKYFNKSSIDFIYLREASNITDELFLYKELSVSEPDLDDKLDVGFFERWWKYNWRGTIFYTLGMGGGAWLAFASAGAFIGGAIAAIAGSLGFVISMLLTWYFDIGEVEVRNVHFKCRDWEPPRQGDVNCSKCNDDPFKKCTEYRCNALGQFCKLLNSDDEKPICVNIYEDETNPPILSSPIVEEGYSFENKDFVNNKITLKSNTGNGEIEEFSTIKIDFETDEFAKCKWSLIPSSNYNGMENQSTDSGLLSENHYFTFNVPRVDEQSNVEGDVVERRTSMSVYLRCEDALEYPNANIDPYVINFRIKTQPDRTEIDQEQIRAFPESGVGLKYNKTEQDVKFYLNKPAECKYSNESDIEYSNMQEDLTCDTSISRPSMHGWPCQVTFKNLTKGENNFYIKCKAQPWLEGTPNASERAVSTKDYSYKLQRSESPLVISSTYPTGTLEKGQEISRQEIRVTTEGGIDNGKSSCSYWWKGSLNPFFDTNTNQHTLKLPVFGGKNNIEIECKDNAGNRILGNVTFNVNVDLEPPIIVRAYREDNKLKLITNEEAACYYSFDSCSFPLESENKITTGMDTEHSRDWVQDKSYKTYYIKCKDEYGHTNRGCAMIVEPSSLS